MKITSYKRGKVSESGSVVKLAWQLQGEESNITGEDNGDSFLHDWHEGPGRWEKSAWDEHNGQSVLV